MNENYKCTFERYEVKYVLNRDQYKQLREKLQDKFEAEQYGKSTICNIYFDTPSHFLIRTSLEKPVYKEKLRIRSYGMPKPEDTVFIELKKKYKGVVYKRRETMELKGAERYLYQGESAGKTTQITKEIDWFLTMHQALAPSMYISYDRIAMYGKEDPELRITFDSNLVWRKEKLSLTDGIWGTPILEPGQRLMEIKILGAMPVWLANLLTELAIYPSSFSKYGKGYLKSEEFKKYQVDQKQKGDEKYA